MAESKQHDDLMRTASPATKLRIRKPTFANARSQASLVARLSDKPWGGRVHAGLGLLLFT